VPTTGENGCSLPQGVSCGERTLEEWVNLIPNRFGHSIPF